MTGTTEAPAFKCSVCGAPAHAGDHSCRFCGAGIATRCCSRCFHLNMQSALHCSGCGAELNLVVESQVQGNQCCDCHTPMEAFSEPHGTLLVCRRCGGQFLEHALLRNMIVEREGSGQAVPEGPYSRPLQKAALEHVHYRPCVLCGQLMNRKNFGGISGVIVDVCAKHGTWFDPGELPQVLSFVQSGGLVRERAREREREQQERAHERERAGSSESAPLSFDSLAVSRSDEQSMARDLLAFVIEVLGHDHKA